MWFAAHPTLIIRGLVTLAFGLALMVWPSSSLDAFVALFGAFTLADGTFILATAIFADRGAPGREMAFVAGILAVVTGLVAFLWPHFTELALLILIAVRALIIGVTEIVIAAYVGRLLGSNGLATVLFVSIGLLSIVFGALLLAYPATGQLVLLRVAGVYTMCLGLLTIARASAFALSSGARGEAVP